MVYLVTNLAQINTLMREIVRKFFTSQKLGLLIQLLDAFDSPTQSKLLKLIQNFSKICTQAELTNSVCHCLPESELALSLHSSPLASYFLDLAV